MKMKIQYMKNYEIQEKSTNKEAYFNSNIGLSQQKRKISNKPYNIHKVARGKKLQSLQKEIYHKDQSSNK